MSFEIPEKARAALASRTVKPGGRIIEWNGTKAYWDPDDLAIADGLRAQQAAGEITAAELRNQIDHLHEVKLLGGILVRDEPESDPEQETLL